MLSKEAQTGFEPVDTGVADHCLTTWLLRHTHFANIVCVTCYINITHLFEKIKCFLKKNHNFFNLPWERPNGLSFSKPQRIRKQRQQQIMTIEKAQNRIGANAVLYSAPWQHSCYSAKQPQKYQ